MKRFEFHVFVFATILLFGISCTGEEGQFNEELINKPANRKTVNYKPDSANQIVMIYDYDTESSKLQYRPIKIQNPSGNYLKDALNAFIENNHFLESTKGIRFEKTENKEDEIVLYFSGFENSSNQKEKMVFFKKALELTIARNFQGKKYKIVLNEEIP